MTQTISVNEISIQTVIKLAKGGDEIVLEENGKPNRQNHAADRNRTNRA